jgi:hypothetical protein
MRFKISWSLAVPPVEESSRRGVNSRGCSEKPAVSEAKRKERGLGTEDATGDEGSEGVWLQNR